MKCAYLASTRFWVQPQPPNYYCYYSNDDYYYKENKSHLEYHSFVKQNNEHMANSRAKKKEVKAKYCDEKKRKQVNGHCGLNYVTLPTPGHIGFTCSSIPEFNHTCVKSLEDR